MKRYFIFICIFFLNAILGQSPGDIDTSFDVGVGFDNNVFASVLQNDGKIIVGGQFVNFQGLPQNRLVRLNSDGSKDSTFDIGTGFNQYVGCLAIQNDGKILVGGGFLTYQGLSYKSLIRLNIDGSVDTTFNIGTGFNGVVSVLRIQNDGKILVGGNFNTYNNQSLNNVIRLNTDGTVDSTFTTGDYLNGVINSITQEADNKILVSGGFTSYLGQSQNGLIRFNSDGSKDTSFNIGTGFNPNPNSTVTQLDGKIIVSGWFSSYQGQSQNYLIRLNSDGSKDTSFNIGTGFNGNTYPIILEQSGKIIVGGQFTMYQGQSQNYLIRLNSDGSKDLSFEIGVGFNNRTFSIFKQIDEKLVVAGGFTSYKGQTKSRMLRLIGGESLSSNDFESLQSKIYPIPTNHILNIFIENNINVNVTKILDMRGATVYESNMYKENLNLDFLNSGIYYLIIETDKGVLNKKIIKN